MQSGHQRVLFALQQWKYWDEIQVGAEKEYAMPKERFKMLLPEYCRFMGLIVLGYRGLGMFSNEIDTIWHAHILNTLRYEQFCTTFMGKMIHHVPNLHKGMMKYQELAPNCEEPGPSCKEPDPSPSCLPEPEPSCIESTVPLSGFKSMREAFRQAYRITYGQEPGEVWNISASDGTTYTY